MRREIPNEEVSHLYERRLVRLGSSCPRCEERTYAQGLESLDPTQAMTEEDIRTAIQNAAGTKAVLLLPEEPFEVLVRQAIKKMTEPCQKCARIVHDELGRIARQLISNQDVQRYPCLAQSIEDATRDFLAEV